MRIVEWHSAFRVHGYNENAWLDAAIHAQIDRSDYVECEITELGRLGGRVTAINEPRELAPARVEERFKDNLRKARTNTDATNA